MPLPAGTLTCHDDTTAGNAPATLILHDLDTTVTLRDLIRHRIREEFARHGGDHPLADRATPAGPGWQARADAALRSFERNGFVVLVGGRQVVDLDERIDTHRATEVTFLKLVPLAGG
jgi:hypothetical protein